MRGRRSQKRKEMRLRAINLPSSIEKHICSFSLLSNLSLFPRLHSLSALFTPSTNLFAFAPSHRWAFFSYLCVFASKDFSRNYFSFLRLPYKWLTRLSSHPINFLWRYYDEFKAFKLQQLKATRMKLNGKLGGMQKTTRQTLKAI